MGGKSRQSSNFESHAEIEAMGPQEQALVNRFQSLGMNQADAVDFVLKNLTGQLAGGKPSINMLALTGQDKALLEQSYAGAEQNLRRFGNLLGQDLAGTRGLNPSDTPVSEAVLRETLPVMANLQSQKAQQELGLGLNLGQLNEGARQFNLNTLMSGAFNAPQTGFGLMGRMQNERFARARQYGSSQGSFTKSTGDSIAQGFGMYKDFGSGTLSLAQAAKTFSDSRLKREIRPMSWKWKGQDEKTYLGVIAQEVAKFHPHLVERNDQGHLLVDYGAMVAMLLSERELLYERLTSTNNEDRSTIADQPFIAGRDTDSGG